MPNAKEINRKWMFDWRLRSMYGITPEQYEQMLSQQGNKCAICKKPFSSTRDTHIDHNHLTNYVRGLLCSNCNLGIGNFQDSEELLNEASRYIARTGTPDNFTFKPLPNPPRGNNSSSKRTPEWRKALSDSAKLRWKIIKESKCQTQR